MAESSELSTSPPKLSTSPPKATDDHHSHHHHHHHHHSQAPPGARTVILAVDRSEQAEHAFDWYAKILHKPDNHLLLIHVPEGATLEMSKGQRLTQGEINKLSDIEKQENEEMTTKYKKKLEDAGVVGEYRVMYGKPGEALVEAARAENASMVVMGTRGMGTLRRTIMGSVSDYVVHHAHVPVVVCRHHHS